MRATTEKIRMKKETPPNAIVPDSLTLLCGVPLQRLTPYGRIFVIVTPYIGLQSCNSAINTLKFISSQLWLFSRPIQKGL
jgi:hypothetical protein